MSPNERGHRIDMPSLPKGGGAIASIGSSWSADGSGCARFEVPLPLSPGLHGTPDMSLSYRSDGGNGTLGIGWTIAVPTIRRRTSHGVPRYDETDVFEAPGGQRLVAAEERDADTFRGQSLGSRYRVRRYRRRVDTANDRIECWTTPDQPAFWLIHAADGRTMVFGKSVDARLADPDRPACIAEWRLQEIMTPMGAHTRFDYIAEDGAGATDARDSRAARYLSRIRYGHREGSPALYAFVEDPPGDEWHFDLLLDYGQRDTAPTNAPTYTPIQPWPRRLDAFSDFAYGFEHRQLRLCRQALMFHRFDALGDAPVLVRRLLMDYDEQPWMTRLIGVQRMGYGVDGNAQHDAPLDFIWDDFDVDAARVAPLSATNDWNDHSRFQLVDLYGEGIPGILHTDGDTWLYREPLRSSAGENEVTYGEPRPMPRQPTPRGRDTANDPWRGPDASSRHAVATRRLLARPDGDGRLAWMLADPALSGFFALDERGEWSPFVPFSALPSEIRHAHAQWVVLTGNGLDLVLVGPKSVRLWPHDAERGYGSLVEVEHTPDRLPIMGAQDAFVAFTDLLGSGQSHLVRIDVGGEITCWPSLGRGHFGAPFRVGHIDPGEPLRPDRVFLADVDGSGANDIFYASGEALLCFRNQAGQGFDPAFATAWPEGRRYDDTWEIVFGDLAGMGCASALVTLPFRGDSLPALRHWRIDFSISKPYLMIGTNDNRGCATHIAYRSSAQAWLDEKASLPPNERRGSHLPFPLHLVASVSRVDEVSGSRQTSHYAWSGGFYDNHERRLRGFSRTEVYEEGDDQSAGIMIRTWHHVGNAALDSRLDGYDTSDADAIRIDPPLFTRWIDEFDSIDESFDDDECGELWKALSGQIRRVETFPVGSGGAVGTPIATTESRYLVRQVTAPTASTLDGTSLCLPVETVTYTYEDTPGDPRRRHELAIRLDGFGFATRTLTIDCARRPRPSPQPRGEDTGHGLDSHDQEQAAHRIVVTHTLPWHGDDPEGWRLGLPGDTRQDAAALPATSADILHAHYETFAQTDELPGNPALLFVGARSVVYPAQPPSFTDQPVESHIAAIDTVALAEYATVLPADELTRHLRDGGYVPFVSRLVAVGAMLATVGDRRQYDPSLTRFFRPVRRSPHGTVGWTTWEYDVASPYPVASIGPDGLERRVSYDYIHLMPWQAVDANGNLAEVIYDALGYVVATTFHGHETDTSGQCVAKGFAPASSWRRPDDTSLANAIEHPLDALGGMATAHRYDTRSWMGTVTADGLRADDAAHHRVTHDGRVRSRGRSLFQRTDTPRHPVHAVSMVADRYTDIAESTIRIDVTAHDGFGRILHVASLVPDDDDHGAWAIADRTVFGARGFPARRYRPRFADTWRASDPPDDAPCKRYVHDALGRTLRTVDEKGRDSLQTFHAWYDVAIDANRTAELARGTTTGLSTPVLSAIATDGVRVRRVTYLRLTSEDVPMPHVERVTADAAGRASRTYDARSSVSDTPIRTTSAAAGSGHTWSADAGDTWILPVDHGAPVWTRAPDGECMTYAYDTAGRIVERHVCTRADEATSGRLVGSTTYGGSAVADAAANLAGMPTRVYDEAGRHDIVRVGLDGVVQEKTLRLLLRDTDPDWATTPDEWIEPTAAVTVTETNALGETVEILDAGGHAQQFVYGVDGAVTSIGIALTGSARKKLVKSIRRDAEGRPVAQYDANGVVRAWIYDAADGRLAACRATRADGTVLRDLAFDYDEVGNVLRVDDRAAPLQATARQRIAALNGYRYDSFHRLIEATGREDIRATHGPGLPPDLPIGNTTGRLRPYTRTYAYDGGSNLVQMRHTIPGDAAAGFTRRMIVAPLSNRALPEADGIVPETVDAHFNAAGCPITLQPGGQPLRWDGAQRLRAAATVTRQSGDDEETYLYTRDGRRVRKRWTRLVADVLRTDDTRYVDTLVRRTDGITGEVRETVTILAAGSRFTIHHWPNQEHPDAVRFDLDDHPVSARLCLDDTGAIASYDEYYPFGGNALQACREAVEIDWQISRYANNERDATGLYAVGQRYLAPWLWRWLSPDPAGYIDGLNRYAMAGNNPSTFQDNDGQAWVSIGRLVGQITLGVGATIAGNRIGNRPGQQPSQEDDAGQRSYGDRNAHAALVKAVEKNDQFDRASHAATNVRGRFEGLKHLAQGNVPGVASIREHGSAALEYLRFSHTNDPAVLDKTALAGAAVKDVAINGVAHARQAARTVGNVTTISSAGIEDVFADVREHVTLAERKVASGVAVGAAGNSVIAAIAMIPHPVAKAVALPAQFLWTTGGVVRTMENIGEVVETHAANSNTSHQFRSELTRQVTLANHEQPITEAAMKMVGRR